LKDLDTVITDRKPSSELAAALADAGVEVVVA
jgi:DeoR family transcriptional regulator, fructose operon transcriptional repressor